MPARIREFSYAVSSEDDYRHIPPNTCVRTNAYASCLYCHVLYSCRRSAALCKMPLLTTDDSIITLRKSYYPRRAICRNVVAVCERARALAHVIVIMMLLAIMKDSGIWRIHRPAPRATRVIHNRQESHVLMLRQGRCYAHARS